MSKIIAICGKICSGKTYYANRIKEKEKAIILSTDEVTYYLAGNKQGVNYDELGAKVNAYLMKKSVEIVNTGCNVILDWGFWTSIQRKEITNYYKERNIAIEWHYMDIDIESWERNIQARNQKVKDGAGDFVFYVDEGLKQKLSDKWEQPDESEIDVWHCASLV